MSPEQKAKELVEKFDKLKLYNAHAAISEEKEHAKQCALICVMEQLEEHSCQTLNNERWEFWKEVKTHLEKL